MAKFTYPEFITAWQGAGSIAEVCEKLGVSRNTVENTRTKLKKAGVKLKVFSQGTDNTARGEIDVSALNALIEQVTPKFDNGTRVAIKAHGDQGAALGEVVHYAGEGKFEVLLDQQCRQHTAVPDGSDVVVNVDAGIRYIGEEYLEALQQELEGVA